MHATPFLYFKGDCESALQFYQACGLGEIVELRRIEGTPLAERDGPAWNQKVLFSRFEGPWLSLCIRRHRFRADEGMRHLHRG